MEDVKALFLAILMTKNEKLVDELASLANNEGVSAELIDSYKSQTSTDLPLMRLFFVAKLQNNEGSKEVLLALLERISTNCTGIDHTYVSRLLR